MAARAVGRRRRWAAAPPRVPLPPLTLKLLLIIILPSLPLRFLPPPAAPTWTAAASAAAAPPRLPPAASFATPPLPSVVVAGAAANNLERGPTTPTPPLPPPLACRSPARRGAGPGSAADTDAPGVAPPPAVPRGPVGRGRGGGRVGPVRGAAGRAGRRRRGGAGRRRGGAHASGGRGTWPGVGGGGGGPRDWDLVRFNMELDRLALRGTAVSAETAERLLFDRLRDFYSAAADSDGVGGGAAAGAAADVISFNSVLNAWAKCGCPERAAALLGRMEHLQGTGALPFGPDCVSYSAAIDAWAQSGEVGAAVEAERILRRVQELDAGAENDGVGAIRPNVRMYSSVLHAYAKSRRPRTALKAERLLREMEESAHVRPNAYCYTSVIDAWAKTRTRGSARRAVLMLNRMLDLFRSGDDSMRPTVVSYAAAMDAWASSGEGSFAAERAEGLLRDLEGGRDGGLPAPNVFTYANVCKAWARSGRTDGGERAEAVYRRMLTRMGEEREARRGGAAANDGEAGDDPSLWPNAVAATAVIDAWAKSGSDDAAWHAERLLGEMERLYEGGNEFMRPDFVAHSAVVDAWAKSGADGAAGRAEAALRRMADDLRRTGEATPPAWCFAVAIRAHLRSGEGWCARRAAALLCWTMELVESEVFDVQLDGVIFRDVLRALAEEISESQRGGGNKHGGNSNEGREAVQLLCSVFELCCAGSMVDDDSLSAVRMAMSPDAFRALLGPHLPPSGDAVAVDVQTSELPSEWSQSTQRGKGRRRRGTRRHSGVVWGPQREA